MSASWVSGGRVSPRVVERRLAVALLSGRHDAQVTRVTSRCVRMWRDANETLGPASGATAVWRHVVHPLADAFGWAPSPEVAGQIAGVPVQVGHARLAGAAATLVALPWGASQEGLQRAATRRGARDGSRWVSVSNGVSWRWYDATRPYAREHLAFDLTRAVTDARVWQALWLLGQTTVARGSGPKGWLDHLLAEGSREAAGEARALRDGVAQALTDIAAVADGDHDTHVRQVFQWLFLLFADARGLRPQWHLAYERSYSIGTLAREQHSGTSSSVAASASWHSPRAGTLDQPARRRHAVGLRESVEAIARLNRDGARLGSVEVPALGGALFAGAPVASGSRAGDEAIARALAALTYGVEGKRDHPLDVAALDVEHLGSIYEHLMAPAAAAGAPALLRKRTGAFYTPRLLADDLVQRTLGPLVQDASSEDILRLRVLDPAMGSGALLASAHRCLVEAVEAAWVREGRAGPLDVSREERELLPRRVAEQCLFGADVNSHAVQVARLSLWLLSMAPDRPLTWLDAHVRVGNSLIGASPALVMERAPGASASHAIATPGQPTLFELARWHHEARAAGAMFDALHAQPTTTASDVHEKQRAHARLRARPDLAVWRRRADAWCGAAMDAQATVAAWRAVDASLREGAETAAGAVAARGRRWLAHAQAQGCLHWSLEFPDVFDAGRGGFDAVIANPPWEMLRGDLGTEGDRAAHRDQLGPLHRFVRRSGLYRDAHGHVNSYQLFLERMRHLLRPRGRLGCLLPGSVLIDQGAAPLRARLFDATEVDRISVISNRGGLFPVHRSMRIVAVSATSARGTDALIVDDGPDMMSGPARRPAAPRLLTRQLLRRGGPGEAVPHLQDADELRLFELLLAVPRLGGDEWGLRFGRELNATEDRGRLRPGATDGLPVVDGKHLQAFTVRPPLEGPRIAEEDAREVLPHAPWRSWRLAYRDVSGATNARSLIAALLPPGCLSTHTLFCLRTPTSLRGQLYLCGLVNSLAADWFVRRFLGSHVTARLMSTVPVPRPPANRGVSRRTVNLVLRLMRQPDDAEALIALQVLAATLYSLDRRAMAVILRDFPRLDPAVRDGVLSRLT